MATKDLILFGENQKHSNYSIGDPFNNINLNKTGKRYKVCSTSFESVSNDTRKILKNDFTDSKNRETKTYTSFRSKPSNLGITDFEKLESQKKVMEKRNPVNNSTLSLHISAYENSLDTTASGDSQISNLKNLFEMERQQKSDWTVEIMHYKASKKLFNPNSFAKTPQAASTNSVIQSQASETRCCRYDSRTIQSQQMHAKSTPSATPLLYYLLDALISPQLTAAQMIDRVMLVSCCPSNLLSFVPEKKSSLTSRIVNAAHITSSSKQSKGGSHPRVGMFDIIKDAANAEASPNPFSTVAETDKTAQPLVTAMKSSIQASSDDCMVLLVDVPAGSPNIQLPDDGIIAHGLEKYPGRSDGWVLFNSRKIKNVLSKLCAAGWNVRYTRHHTINIRTLQALVSELARLQDVHHLTKGKIAGITALHLYNDPTFFGVS